MSDYVLQVRVKNGPLLRAIRAAGFKTVAALSRVCDVHQTSIGHYLSLKRSPQTEAGEWRRDFLRIADAVRMMPEDLCPPQHFKDPLSVNSGEIEASLEDIAAYLPTSVDPQATLEHRQAIQGLREKISNLPPRLQDAVNKRFGLVDGVEHTYRELSQELGGVSVERARQIEYGALRKLRNMYRREDRNQAAAEEKKQ